MKSIYYFSLESKMHLSRLIKIVLLPSVTAFPELHLVFFKGCYQTQTTKCIICSSWDVAKLDFPFLTLDLSPIWNHIF